MANSHTVHQRAMYAHVLAKSAWTSWQRWWRCRTPHSLKLTQACTRSNIRASQGVPGSADGAAGGAGAAGRPGGARAGGAQRGEAGPGGQERGGGHGAVVSKYRVPHGRGDGAAGSKGGEQGLQSRTWVDRFYDSICLLWCHDQNTNYANFASRHKLCCNGCYQGSFAGPTFLHPVVEA